MRVQGRQREAKIHDWFQKLVAGETEEGPEGPAVPH